MTTGEFFASPAFPIVLLCSAAGAWYACPNWGSRLWFLVFAPVLCGFLWLIVGAAVMLPLLIVYSLGGNAVGESWHFWLTTGATFAIYVLFCIMLRRDGKAGLRMRGYGSSYSANTGRCFNPNSSELPDTASSRRFKTHI